MNEIWLPLEAFTNLRALDKEINVTFGPERLPEARAVRIVRDTRDRTTAYTNNSVINATCTRSDLQLLSRGQKLRIHFKTQGNHAGCAIYRYAVCNFTTVHQTSSASYQDSGFGGGQKVFPSIIRPLSPRSQRITFVPRNPKAPKEIPQAIAHRYESPLEH